MTHDDGVAGDQPHGRRATDRQMRSTPFRFDWGVSFGQALIIVPLIVAVTSYAANNASQTEYNKQQAILNQAQIDKLQINVTAQIADFKEDVAAQFQNQQTVTATAFATFGATITVVPGLTAALPELRDRIARMEQDRATDRARLDAVQAEGVETKAQLHAALQAKLGGK